MINLSKTADFTYLFETHDDGGSAGPFVQLDRSRAVESMTRLLRYSYSDPSYYSLKKSWSHNPHLKKISKFQRCCFLEEDAKINKICSNFHVYLTSSPCLIIGMIKYKEGHMV